MLDKKKMLNYMYKEERDAMRFLYTEYNKDEAFVFAVSMFKKADETVRKLVDKLEKQQENFGNTKHRNELVSELQQIRTKLASCKNQCKQLKSNRNKLKTKDLISNAMIKSLITKFFEIKAYSLNLEQLLKFYDNEFKPESITLDIDKLRELAKEKTKRVVTENQNQDNES